MRSTTSRGADLRRRGRWAFVALAIAGALALVVAGRARGHAAGASLWGAPLPAKVRSRAVDHVPEGCDVTARVDLARAIEVPAVKAHVLAALDEITSSVTADPRGKRLLELARRTGIEPAKDLREAVLCGVTRPEGHARAAVVLAGDLRPEAIATAFERAYRDDAGRVAIVEGRKVLKADGGGRAWVLGQAADGAIVLATDMDLFASAARVDPERGARASLPADTEIAFVIGAPVLDRVLRDPRRAHLRVVDTVRRVTGRLALASPRGEIRLSLADPAAAAELEEALLGGLLPAVVQRAEARTRSAALVEALRGARARSEGSEVVLDLPWTEADLDRAARTAAEMLRRKM